MPEEQDLKNIIAKLKPAEQKMAAAALDYAMEMHCGQLRKSGEPFINHIFIVALNLWQQFKDVDLMIAGLAHDVVEDCDDVPMKEIYERFGSKIGFIVDAVTKKKEDFEKKKGRFKDKIERLLWAGMQNVRVLLLKIVDRRHNISTIEFLGENKQVRMTFETQAIFEPLKEVLKFDKAKSVQQAENNLQSFLNRSKISTPKQFKEYLYGNYFQKLDEYLYDEIYKDSDKVVWEIESASLFEKLTTNKEFCHNAEILSLWTNGDDFKGKFILKRGFILSGRNAKMQVATYRK